MKDLTYFKLANLPVANPKEWIALCNQLRTLDIQLTASIEDEGDYWYVQLQGLGYTLSATPAKPALAATSADSTKLGSG